jgi:hypothetical protein
MVAVMEGIYDRLRDGQRLFTGTHGAFALDETVQNVLLDDTLALAHLDVNKMQGTIDAFSLALAEHGEELITLSRLVLIHSATGLFVGHLLLGFRKQHDAIAY